MSVNSSRLAQPSAKPADRGDGEQNEECQRKKLCQQKRWVGLCRCERSQRRHPQECLHDQNEDINVYVVIPKSCHGSRQLGTPISKRCERYWGKLGIHAARPQRSNSEVLMSRLKPLALVALILIPALPLRAQRVPEARLKPVPAAEWTVAHREALGTYARGEDTLDVFQTCLRNVELCRNWMGFTNYILSDRSSITTRDRELLILRTGYLCRSDYEWAQHAALAMRIGFTPEELTRIIRGPDAAGWSRADAALLQAADELHRDQHVSDATWTRLRERFDDRQMMDIVFTVGQYTIVSMYLNSAGVQLEKGQTGIPR